MKAKVQVLAGGGGQDKSKSRETFPRKTRCGDRLEVKREKTDSLLDLCIQSTNIHQVTPKYQRPL